MEITTLQIVLVFIVACIAGMGSILDEFQFHRPLIACTLVGIVLGDMKTGIIIGGTCNQVNHLIPTRLLVKGGEITCKMLK